MACSDVLAYHEENSAISLYNVATGKTAGRLSVGDLFSIAYCMDFSPDGKLLAVGYADGTVCVWDVASGKLLHRISAHTNKDHKRTSAHSLAFSPDSRRLATGGSDTLIHIYPMGSRKSAKKPRPKREVVKRNPLRTWRSASGKFTISARLLDHDGTNVRLEKKDGRIITVPISKLSTADGKYLAARPKAEIKAPKKQIDEK